MQSNDRLIAGLDFSIMLPVGNRKNDKIKRGSETEKLFFVSPKKSFNSERTLLRIIAAVARFATQRELLERTFIN